MTLLLASETGRRWRSRAVRGTVTSVTADSTVSSEGAFYCWVGAVGLVVAVKGQSKSSFGFTLMLTPFRHNCSILLSYHRSGGAQGTLLSSGQLDHSWRCVSKITAMK